MNTLIGYDSAEWCEDVSTFYDQLDYEHEVGMGEIGAQEFEEKVDGLDEEYLRDLANVSDNVMILAESKADVDEIAGIVLTEDSDTMVESFSSAGLGMHQYEPLSRWKNFRETVFEYTPFESSKS